MCHAIVSETGGQIGTVTCQPTVVMYSVGGLQVNVWKARPGRGDLVEMVDQFGCMQALRGVEAEKTVPLHDP